MAAPSTRYKTINSHHFTWTGLLKCSGRAVAIPPSLSLYSPAKKGGHKAKDWNLMSYRLPHSLVPARRRTSICDHRFIPSPANSRVWWCSNRNKNGTEMEQLVYGSNSKGSSEVVVADPLLLEKKKAAIRLGGPAKLQVIADFDATLTKYCIDGGQRQSSHGLLQQLNPEYDVKRQKLFEYYHPLEINPTIPIDEKAKLMEEWWEKTHALLIEGGLTYDGIKNSVANATIAFREGVVELFELFEERNVPVLIFSAGVADVIKEVLKQKLHRSFKNVKIVSNWMVFDQHGHLASFKGKTIHVLNKNEHALDMAAAVHDQLGDINGQIDDNASVQKRTNVLLLGDHIGDLGMSDGLNYETRISVGFLNHGIKNSLDSYRNAFDVVYLDDASMWGVVKLVSHLFSTGSE